MSVTHVDIPTLERAIKALFIGNGDIKELVREGGNEKVDQIATKSLRWRLSTVLGKNIFVKAEPVPNGKFWVRLAQKGTAHDKNKRHNPRALFLKGFLCYPIYVGNKISYYEIMDYPRSSSGVVHLELQRRIKIESSYADELQKHPDVETATRRDKAFIRKICVLLKKTHLPARGHDWESYADFLKSLLRDKEDYIPIEGTHPTLSEREILNGCRIGRRLACAWTHKQRPLVELHGDVYEGNVAFVKDDSDRLVAELIDYHARHNQGDRGFDYGRLLMSFVRRYLISANPRFKENGQYLLETGAHIARDRELASAVWMGAYSRMWMFVNPPAGAPDGSDHDTLLIRRKIYIGTMRVLEDVLNGGTFNWKPFNDLLHLRKV